MWWVDQEGVFVVGRSRGCVCGGYDDIATLVEVLLRDRLLPVEIRLVGEIRVCEPIIRIGHPRRHAWWRTVLLLWLLLLLLLSVGCGTLTSCDAASGSYSGSTCDRCGHHGSSLAVGLQSGLQIL